MKNCKNCAKELKQREDEKNRDYKFRVFCNRSCSSSYNNKIKPKRKQQPERRIRYCTICNDSFSSKAKRKFCNNCVRTGRLISRGNNASPMGERTKGELFGSRKNWQSARTSIRRHAELICAGKNYVCEVCGYSKHVEICHIKPVKDFENTATLNEINSIDNLVLLCPNHHWELDNSMLALKTE